MNVSNCVILSGVLILTFITVAHSCVILSGVLIQDLVKSGGEFISSVDLENTIMGMASVAAACVVAVPHPKVHHFPSPKLR